MNVAAPSSANLVKNLAQLQADTSQMNGQLKAWEQAGNRVPGSADSDSFDSFASRLDDSTSDLRALHPEKTDLLNQLKADTLLEARTAGQITQYTQFGQAFGSGWGEELDAPTAHLQSAIEASLAPPEAPSEVTPPSPAKLVSTAANLQASLSNLSGEFSGWQSAGDIPNAPVYQEMDDYASKLYDLRNAIQTLHPDQTELLKNIKQDTLKVSHYAGILNEMSTFRRNFNSGWDTLLESPIKDLKSSIELLAK